MTALAVALAATLVPMSVHAVNPPRVYVPYRAGQVRPPAQSTSQSRPPALATVDHPPVDGINAVDNGSRSDNRVALTFDADMTSGMLQQLASGAVRSWYNAEVRNVLVAEQVPATIFLTGLWATTYPDEARSLASDPLFEIGNHSYSHLAFRTPCYGMAGAADRGAEVAMGQAQIRAVTGIAPTLYRFPGDCYDRSDVELARSHGLTVISGDVRGSDAFNASAGAIVSNVLSHLGPGSIVVLHLHGGPNAPMTAVALRAIIPAVRARGLAFTTVSSLLGRAPARTSPAGGVAMLESLRLLPLELPRAPELPFAVGRVVWFQLVP